MIAKKIHDFGLVEEAGDAFELTVQTGANSSCRLVSVVQTERGPRRTDIASLSSDLWRTVEGAVVRELASEMGESERSNKKRAPTFRSGLNRLSPLLGRELGVLLIALMEEGAIERVDAFLHAWRELAREERWWLYAKAAAPGQRIGSGWRRALFHALSEVPDSRAEISADFQKKSVRTTKIRSQTKPKGKRATKKPAESFRQAPPLPKRTKGNAPGGTKSKAVSPKRKKNDGQLDLL